MLFGRSPPDFLISKPVDFRESAMPDSPDTKLNHPSTLSPKTGPSVSLPPSTRPLSSNSSISGINGNHSPLSTLNGRTPSPPMVGSLMNSSMGQQLPPACGARQLSKLKRFLTTLQQFGSDISPEIGERVRSLVLGLVNSHLSIEEFHAKLQEATNFPLRPFVIPFLKANLPLLQRELLHCARMAKQSPQQFLTQNEHIVFDPAHSPLDARDAMSADLMSDSRKRNSPDRPKENTLDLHLDGPTYPAKRHHGSHPISPVSSSRVSPGSNFNFSTGGPIRLEDISKSRELRERERMEREQMERERDRERHLSSYSYRSSEPLDTLERLDEDWRHVETMLNCIMGMVDKTKRAMVVLQERSIRDREELAIWARRQSDSLESDTKKRPSSDSMAFTLRQTEDRVTEVRRRAEEAVNDVKRQAMLELQKAMSAADQKAMDLLAAERSKMERTISEARKQTQEEMMRSFSHQEESVESCWNCGRKASETCSGCNVARYCGSFCQHKDWENHHHVCGKSHITTVAEAREQRRLVLSSAAAAVAAVSTTHTPFTSATSSLPVSIAANATSSLPSSSSSSLSSSSSSTAGTLVDKGHKDTIAFSVSPSQAISSLRTPSAASNTAMASLSPAPPVLPNLSNKDVPSTSSTLAASSPISSPRSLNPTDSNPNSPGQEAESAEKMSLAEQAS